MTKLEALRLYTDARIRDTWMYYGGKTLSANNLQWLDNDIFLLSNPGGNFDGAIMFSTKEVIETTPIDWAAHERYDAATLDQIATSDLHIIHPYVFCLMDAAQLAAVGGAGGWDNTFIPFPDIDPIEISDEELQVILLEAGVPFITPEELEFTRDQILSLMIKPAMKEFFKWFPLITIEVSSMASFQIDETIPPWAFGVQRVWVNPGYPINQAIGNPLIRYFDEVMLASSSRGAFSNPQINYKRKQGFVDTNAYSTFMLEKAVRQAAVNYGSRMRVRVDVRSGKITGYCNKTGTLEIEYAQASNKWEDIPYNRQAEVRDLAKAYVLRAFGMLRSQQDASSPGRLNYDHFVARADLLEQKVKDLWAAYPKMAIIRG